MTAKIKMTVEVNGADRSLVVEPRETLADVLRVHLDLTGTRVGCDEGACGACTVLVNGEPVRACTLFAVQAHNAVVRTVEGLSDSGALHPLQTAFAEQHAVQCGFCTAGFLMLAVGALERDPFMSEEALAELLCANLCRCFAQGAMLKAVRAAQVHMRGAVDT